MEMQEGKQQALSKKDKGKEGSKVKPSALSTEKKQAGTDRKGGGNSTK